MTPLHGLQRDCNLTKHRLTDLTWATNTPDMHDDDNLVSLSELEEHAKKCFGESFDTREKMYVDAFSNGRYHEEEPSWYEIASRLENANLGNLCLAAIKCLISGTIDCRDGDALKTIITFHEAMAKYLKGHLKDFSELSGAMLAFRRLLFENAEREGGSWFADVVRGFSLVEMAIEGRMGLWSSPTSSEYDSALSRIAPRHNGL